MNKRIIREEKQEQYAEIIRVLWRHENDLMNARFTWFITIQTILFAGLGLGWQNKIASIAYGSCALGIVVSASTWAAFALGFNAMDMLGKWWKKNLPFYKGPSITGNPVLIENKGWNVERVKSEMSPWKLLPKVFFITWLVFLFYIIFKGLKLDNEIINPIPRFVRV